jgi:hypothetical protein
VEPSKHDIMFTKATSLMLAMSTTIISQFDIKPAEFGQMIDIEME